MALIEELVEASFLWLRISYRIRRQSQGIFCSSSSGPMNRCSQYCRIDSVSLNDCATWRPRSRDRGYQRTSFRLPALALTERLAAAVMNPAWSAAAA